MIRAVFHIRMFFALLAFSLVATLAAPVAASHAMSCGPTRAIADHHMTSTSVTLNHGGGCEKDGCKPHRSTFCSISGAGCCTVSLQSVPEAAVMLTAGAQMFRPQRDERGMGTLPDGDFRPPRELS